METERLVGQRWLPPSGEETSEARTQRLMGEFGGQFQEE